MKPKDLVLVAVFTLGCWGLAGGLILKMPSLIPETQYMTVGPGVSSLQTIRESAPDQVFVEIPKTGVAEISSYGPFSLRSINEFGRMDGVLEADTGQAYRKFKVLNPHGGRYQIMYTDKLTFTTEVEISVWYKLARHDELLLSAQISTGLVMMLVNVVAILMVAMYRTLSIGWER